MRMLSAAILIIVLFVSVLVPGTPTASADGGTVFSEVRANTQPSYNGLALTPPMGWSTWAGFKDTLNEALVLKQAQFLVDSGLAAKGYRYVNVDCCWMLRRRNIDGQLITDPAKFPSGMKSLSAKLHRMGLKFGLYTDAGDGKACGQSFAGSYGHEQQDIKQFLAWGIDYLKIDGCYVNEIPGSDPEVVAKRIYDAWSTLLRNSGRNIVLSNSAPAYFSFRNQQFQASMLDWAPSMSNLWRVGLDIANYDAPRASQWATMIRNFEYTAPLRRLAGPGHFNDPDYLIIGNGLSMAESRTQMGLWVMLAAQLMLSTDLTKLPKSYFRLISNSEAIDINQDPLGIQGKVISKSESHVVMVKPLHDGTIALLLANLGERGADIETSLARIGAPAIEWYRHYRVLGVFDQKNGETTDSISAFLPPHDSALFVLSPATNWALLSKLLLALLLIVCVGAMLLEHRRFCAANGQ